MLRCLLANCNLLCGRTRTLLLVWVALAPHLLYRLRQRI
jgi:hypothetical protein